MITLDTAPAKIAYSKNELPIVLLSDDFRAGVPAVSVNALEFPGEVTAEDIIHLSWINGVATMTAKAVPDESGLTFPAGDGSWAYVQTLVEYFAGNYFIDRDYTVVADENVGGNPRLLFTAINQSPDLDFTEGGDISVITPGATDATKDNFRHHVQIPIGPDNALCLNANVPLDIRTAGITTIDISRALDGYLAPDLPTLTDLYLQCTKSIKSYFIKFAQFYGSPTPTVRRIYKSEEYFVVLGGLGLQAAATGDLLSELRPNLGDRSTWRCLRQGSKNKLIRKEQPELLVWINLGDESVDVKLAITFVNYL
jgi:hypothetical protein